MPSRSAISFIVPAYNVAQYLEACMQSILAASLPGDEIILVNDGSTDSTAELCASWAQRNPQLVMLIQQNNQGLSAARNNALQYASRPYVLFMDSDDVVIPESLHKVRPILAKESPDITVLDFSWWIPERNNERKRSRRCSHPARQLLVDRQAFSRETFADTLLSACSRIFRLDLLQGIGPEVFPIGDAYEEIAAVPRLTLRARSLYYLDEPLFDYRVRSGSITQSKTAKNCLDLSKALTQAIREIHPQGLDDSVELAANMAAAKLLVKATRDCGLVLHRPPTLYRRVLQQGQASLSLPIETISNALLSSPAKEDRRAAKHLRMYTRFPDLYIALRQLVYSIKRRKLQSKSLI